MITVQLLGGACLRAGDAPIAGPPAQRHRVALLTLVVAAWPQPLSRDRAMSLLWPERDEASARRLLNLAVHVLRGTLGDEAIVSTGDGLLLEPSRVRCDLHDLRAAIAAGDAERIVRLHAGPLLDGFHLAESAEFGFWLDDRRRELAHAHVGALRTLAARHERAGDVHAWVGACRRLVAADPHAAAHARALMRALDAAGDRIGAIQHAAEHARRVRAELDLEPDPDVAALAEELRRAPAPRRPAADVLAPARRAVAVLPFRTLGPAPDGDWFADGITEDVIAHLSKIRALTVIARASVMPFRERNGSLKEIAATLGATTVLDGSLRHAGDRVRIVASLVDATTDRHLWAETYDRDVADIFAIQSDVALRIAEALEAELSRDERARVAREPTADVRAYRLFLEARQALIRFTRESLLKAIALLDRAIARDPAFALAHAHVAMAYTELAEGGHVPPDAAFARAGVEAEAALRLDPELAAAHFTSAHLKLVRDVDWAGAERGFQRALELSPSHADAYDLYGRLCAGLGRHDDAIALSRRAQELDPLAHRVDLVTALLRGGRIAEALASAEEAVELDPDSSRAHATLGWAFMLAGRHDAGVAELERAVELSPGNTLWLGQLGQAYGMAGETAKAREVLRRLEERAAHAFVSPYHLAYVHTGLGDAERALDWLERAVADRAGPVYGIPGSFLLAPLRGEPRFRALLARLHVG